MSARVLEQALWFSVPVILGGLIHIGVIRMNWLPVLAGLPLDARCTIRGRQLFGSNKTLRGLLVMIGATALASAALGWLLPDMPARLSVADLQRDRPALWGVLLGAGYVLGELPNSFLKRQLDIPPGATAAGSSWRALLWTIDQTDSLIGILLLLAFVWTPERALLAAMLAVTLALHPAIAALMVLLELKDRIG